MSLKELALHSQATQRKTVELSGISANSLLRDIPLLKKLDVAQSDSNKFMALVVLQSAIDNFKKEFEI